MANRRHFLSILTGAAAACSAAPPKNDAAGDEIELALRDLNQAAGIGIADDDFERARSYAAGAYREAAKNLRSIELDSSLDLPVAFAAKRGGR